MEVQFDVKKILGGDADTTSASRNPAPVEDAVPKISQADKEKVQKIVAIWNNLDIRWKDFYVEVGRNFEYLIDNQLSPEVRKILKEEGRPELIFNFLLSLVNYIAGTIAQNKFKMRAIPIRKGDELKAEMHTVLNEWAMQNCDGDYEIAKASVTAAIAKIGWTNNFWDANAPGGGKWVTRSINPFQIRMDPDTKQEDMSDCRYIGMQGFYSAEEIIKMFKLSPEVIKTIRKNAKSIEGQFPIDDKKPRGWLDNVFGGAADWFNPNRTNRSDGFFGDQGSVDAWMDGRTGIYRVVEFHDNRRIVRSFGYNPITSEQIVVPADISNDPEKYQAYKDEHPGVYFFDSGKDEKWVTAICPRLLPDQPLVEFPYAVQDAGFQFKPIFWYSFHPDLTKSRGVMDNLISSQDYFNQRMMSWLEAVMRGVNPDWIVAKGGIALEDVQAWTSKARGKIKEYADGKKPEREEPMAEVLNSLQGSAELVLDLRNELSGISPNSLGMKDTEAESGVLFNQRVQAGLTMLQSAFSHIQRSMGHIYTYCDRSLQTFVKLPRAVRILGEPPEGIDGVEMDQAGQDAYWLNINMQTIDGVLNDVSEGEYDFKADLTQLGQTAKQAKFQADIQLMQTLPPEYALAIAPIIVRGADNVDAKELSARMEEVYNRMNGIQDQNAQTDLLGKQIGLAGATKQLNGPDPAMIAAEAGIAKEHVKAQAKKKAEKKKV